MHNNSLKIKSPLNYIKNSVPTSRTTQFMSIRKTNQLMLLQKITGVDCGNQIKKKNTHTHSLSLSCVRARAKDAAQDADERNIVYDRIPKTTLATELKMKGLIKWQRQWESTEKGALCRYFFPTMQQTENEDTNNTGVYCYC
jgi:hypothetical protein